MHAKEGRIVDLLLTETCEIIELIKYAISRVVTCIRKHVAGSHVDLGKYAES